MYHLKLVKHSRQVSLSKPMWHSRPRLWVQDRETLMDRSRPRLRSEVPRADPPRE
jgi:hypothetical protein